MAPENLEIVVHPRSFNRSGSGNITGPIWITHGRRDEKPSAFPEESWDDFPVVILGWWLSALAGVGQEEVECSFMDGPYEFTVRDVGSTLLRVRCLGRGINAGELVADFVTPAATLHGAVRDAAAAALSECDRRGWAGRDVEELRLAHASAVRASLYPSKRPA